MKYFNLRIIINFVVPWGNFVCYFYRPDGSNGGALDMRKSNFPSEKLLKEFLEGDTVSSDFMDFLFFFFSSLGL